MMLPLSHWNPMLLLLFFRDKQYSLLLFFYFFKTKQWKNTKNVSQSIKTHFIDKHVLFYYFVKSIHSVKRFFLYNWESLCIYVYSKTTLLRIYTKKKQQRMNNNVMQNTSPEFLLFQVDANNWYKFVT